MRNLTLTLTVSTQGHTDIVDLTPEVEKSIAKHKIVQGTLTLFVNGSTAGITTIEFEPGLVKDLKAAFDRIAPQNIPYAHHEKWGDDNGHAHIRASLLGPSLTVPIEKGRLTLGTWQQIVMVDFDTRARKRTIVLHLMGE